MKKFVIGNLKMNLQNIKEREAYLTRMGKEISKKNMENVEIVLCPPFVHLEGFKKWKNKKIARGAQDVFFEEKGSFTGEISPSMLKDFDCQYVIIGHSERRRYFGESGEFISYKIKAVLKQNIRPILCIGETREEKDSDQTMKIVADQLKEALADIDSSKIKNVVIAYEPIWSVGTDMVPASNEIMSAKLLIKKILHELVGKKFASEVAIIYGGSVNAKTIRQVCLDAEVDGVLVGRESLDPKEFIKIAEIINKNF
ncbi:MAG: triosephosphate isomerase [uncultured bacterium]|nr:MAG: triosephosphate isomerase [uncultured bacterium]HCU70282.1 triose-phosphate isomerase [Candidatus Moranbacteria bacterium]